MGNLITENRTKNKIRALCYILMFIVAIIWGAAFVAQTVAMDSVGPWTFIFLRYTLAFIVLIPFSIYSRKVFNDSLPVEDKHINRMRLLAGGILSGIFLAAASGAQQIGLETTTTAKAGFITALYVIIVPVFGIFLKKIPEKKTWIAVILGLIGLYLIASKDQTLVFGTGDLMVTASAFFYAMQILTLNYYSEKLNPVILSNIEFLISGLIGLIVALLTEKINAGGIQGAMSAVLYVGILSSGVGYTLQSVAEKYTDPTVLSLIMCFESVFSALFGFLLLGQKLNSQEIIGCIVITCGVVLAIIPGRRNTTV